MKRKLSPEWREEQKALYNLSDEQLDRLIRIELDGVPGFYYAVTIALSHGHRSLFDYIDLDETS